MSLTAVSDKRHRIRVLNDNFRNTFVGGRVLTTPGVAELAVDLKAKLFLAVQLFSTFDKDNDPHGEHDFGVIDLEDESYYFKIDYYDLDCRFGSEDPSDPEQTTRVLTIMRADEY